MRNYIHVYDKVKIKENIQVYINVYLWTGIRLNDKHDNFDMF